METLTVFEAAYWIVLTVTTLVSYTYFRDLGDVTQMVLSVKRENMVRAIRHENVYVATGLIGSAGFVALHYGLGVGHSIVTHVMAALNVLLFIGFPWIWLHVGLRNQQSHAKFYSIEQAQYHVRPDESVIVIENNGEARAHPDYHIKRPHLVGTPEGLGGDNIIMTYCCMTHLGHGFKPEINNEKLDLEVLAQVGNNLIMKDMNTGEPIQQVYGTRECDGRFSEKKMQEWPTYRMPFRAFQKAYPEGKVFLNKITPFFKNPLLYLMDHFTEIVFLWGTVPHDRNDGFWFETMDHSDDRLLNKRYVWGFNIGKDSVAYTEEFIRDNGNLVNANVGGRDIVAAYDCDYESVGIYYNDSGKPVNKIDFWGVSDQGKLDRVETVKAGLYWAVWVNFYPETDLNRVEINKEIAA